MTDPTPPTDVRVRRADGSTVPLDLTYEGIGDDGCHRWVATAPTWIGDDSAVHLECALLPPETTIVLELDGEVRA
ncbi:hypothetical protein GCM10023201_41170 [Actinomycetospora corticicola]|uniref:Uncharacterized protein n=1 Tax=Actinomycetospora corticicola TaxID=663602 RepID=A0A7Y9DWP1_9PSEU|nr:hypothetical protein [Actinomycetospora corticicola]NYD36796.1 hypothetical protein [Actinomycetospora corticicola]